ncbi:hypothetical protein NPIL_92061 [Nephila pilipes]|uniref:Uncharacterized protein n=1 Tax=Nephila pilipes TaxID=299642 RepID=A0A8X6TVC6_NEPPI|nr:hypothetical protein NPIL_92061 [Nephila pilipes]
MKKSGKLYICILLVKSEKKESHGNVTNPGQTLHDPGGGFNPETHSAEKTETEFPIVVDDRNYLPSFLLRSSVSFGNGNWQPDPKEEFDPLRSFHQK